MLSPLIVYSGLNVSKEGMEEQKKYTADDALRFAHEYKDLRDELATIRSDEKAAMSMLKDSEAELVQALLQNGMKNIKCEDLGVTIGYARNFKASCTAEFHDMLFTWLESYGLGDLVKRRVDPRILTRTVREIIESGEEIPEFIDQFDELRATVRKIPVTRR